MDQSEVLKFEQQKQITKLSQAIREGAKLRPQCTTGLLFDGVGTCALGAAAEARGWIPTRYVRIRHKEFLPEASDETGLNDLGTDIGHWNDSGMTREAIADKLEAMGY